MWAHKAIRSKPCRDEHEEAALENPRFLRWTFLRSGRNDPR